MWSDPVFTYQFAYGAQGDKLKDKKVIISMTVGQKGENFISSKENLMQSFLRALEHSIDYAQMQLNHSVLSFDISTVAGRTKSEIVNIAINHATQLIQHLQIMRLENELKG